MWLIGNELNLEARNPKVWDAVNTIAEAIHAIDPHHPVMTPLAGFDATLIGELKMRAPALDLIGVQLYGDIEGMQGRLRDAGWTGAYVVTEWGPTGHWESPETAWGAPIEDDASRKAALLAERYARDIDSDRTQGLGSFVSCGARSRSARRPGTACSWPVVSRRPASTRCSSCGPAPGRRTARRRSRRCASTGGRPSTA